MPLGVFGEQSKMYLEVIQFCTTEVLDGFQFGHQSTPVRRVRATGKMQRLSESPKDRGPDSRGT